MADPALDQFFTWTTLGTLAGASGATLIVTNTLKSAFDFSPKWIGLLIAQIICIGTAIYVGKTGSDYIVAVLNGCLIYASATGANSTIAVAATPRGANDSAKIPFFSSW